jgi:hypothetical protein
MYVVQKVRCLGCPTLPFPALKCHEKTGLKAACLLGAHDGVIEFDPAVIERRLEGQPIEAFDGQGWAWYELARIDPSKGGASRAEVDAFRLIAVVLAHWDNKAENQRLMCPQAANARTVRVKRRLRSSIARRRDPGRRAGRQRG